MGSGTELAMYLSSRLDVKGVSIDVVAKELRRLVDKIRTGAVLFQGTNSSAKISELGEFLLDFL
jgi:hypothetical protein